MSCSSGTERAPSILGGLRDRSTTMIARLLVGVDHHQAVRIHQGAQQGILKVMAKMGISTLQSYCGAQIFEAIGSTARSSTPTSRHRLARERHRHRRHRREVRLRHDAASDAAGGRGRARLGGEYQWRRAASTTSSPTPSSSSSTHPLSQDHVYREYTKLVDDHRRKARAGLIELEPAATPIPLDRWSRSNRSSSASPRRHVVRLHQPEAHETLAIAMNRLVGNRTPARGEDAARYVATPTGFAPQRHQQVASARSA